MSLLQELVKVAPEVGSLFCKTKAQPDTDSTTLD